LVGITHFSILQANKVQRNKQNKQTNKEYWIESLKILIFFWGFVFLFTKEEIEESGIQESCRRGEREREMGKKCMEKIHIPFSSLNPSIQSLGLFGCQ
jgi:hypothetical protein